MNMPYGKKFFNDQKDGSLRSAESVVPKLLEVVKPKSVVDVGCGVGTWLSVFQRNGITDVLGIDGSYVDRSMLLIKPQDFLEYDLRKPLHVDRRFDLAICMEVAEHLPPEAASTIVSSLVGLSPIVFFSAAIPHQGGTSHLNEQWQEYWADLFQSCGYVAIDHMRKVTWQDPEVNYYYAQNNLLYVEKRHLETRPDLKRLYELTNHTQLSVVHPQTIMTLGVRQALARIPDAMNRAVNKRVKK